METHSCHWTSSMQATLQSRLGQSFSCNTLREPWMYKIEKQFKPFVFLTSSEKRPAYVCVGMLPEKASQKHARQFLKWNLSPKSASSESALRFAFAEKPPSCPTHGPAPYIGNRSEQPWQQIVHCGFSSLAPDERRK